MPASVVHFVIALGVLSPAPAAEPAKQTCAPEIRYLDFPARIDPLGIHRHVPLVVGSRVYFRAGVRVREMSKGTDGQPSEHTEVVDAASRITRLPNETLVVEPSGTKHHFAAGAIIDRSEPSRNYTIVVIPPGRTLPGYLRSVTPDIEVR